MDLMSVFSRTGGVLPKDRHVSRIELRAQELERQAKKLNMPYNLKPSYFLVNMAPSSYAFISASRHGDGVFGAPFYITDTDQRFWGQDRLDDLDLILSGAL